MTKLISSPNFLRNVLLADAATSAACGLLMGAGAGMLEPLLGLPAALLRAAGIALLPFAAIVAVIATRVHVVRPAVWAVIVLNAAWAVESVLLLVSGWVAPTPFGYAFVVAQAAVVAAFAELEFFGVRRAAPVAASA
ncbi:MAG: hypothetical protein L6R19_00120 [Alphaproteobacteria bacterium]|nr:hypothetical protein [Alphaproteobacteria bacterium]